MPCLKVFVQDPVPHVLKNELSFQCAVNSGESATIDPAYMRQVNWETFFFSDSSAMNEFDSDPIKYCGILTDPISRQRFRAGVESPHSQFDGRNFYFWSDSSKQKFDMMPAMYSAPNLTMEQINRDQDSL